VSRPQNPKVVRQRFVSTALGIGAVLTLAGCGASQTSQTADQVSVVNGAEGDAQAVAVRNVQMAFPQGEAVYRSGASVPLQGVVANGGPTDDRLVQVSSPFAASAAVSGSSEIPSRTSLALTQGPGQGQASVQGGPSGQPSARVELQGLKQDVRPGVTVPVTFTFEKSGSTTVQVPLGTSPEDRSEHGSPAGG
jgi:copper(I)-binding protein